MTPDAPQDRSQEQSIRARKHQLFEADERPGEATGPRTSFRECLQSTPAAPLSGSTKAMLWAVGTVVILLLAAALYKSSHKKPRAPRTTTASWIAPPDPADRSRTWGA